ncbi:MAG TPA: ATP-binding protein [Gemmatimonadaceae bacterium]|jgi:signal transduction histidine kinase
MADPRGAGVGAILPASLPLERKLPLLLAGLVALVLATSLTISYYEERHAAIDMAGERLAALGQALAAFVEQASTQRINVMRRVVRDTAIQNALRAPQKPVSANARKALEPMLIAPGDTITPPELWTAQGEKLGTQQLDVATDAQHLRDELIQAGAAGDSTHVAKLHVADGIATYYIAVAVRAPDHTLLGFVGQERRINFTSRTMSASAVRGILGADVDFFFRNVGDNTWVQLTGTAASPPTGSTTRALDSLQTYSRPTTGQQLSSTTRVRGTPLLVTVERPMTAILARPLATIRLLIAISIVLAVVGAVAVWILTRRIVRPLGDLTRAAEAMAHGRYGQQVIVESGDEIGRLGSAFNRMAAEVQSSSETSTQAVDRLTRSIETQQFLAEASRILAGSVSDDTILTALANYCIPRLADYCSIHVADDGGAIRRIETAHRNPEKLPTVRRLLGHFRYHVDGPGEVPKVIRSQKPVLVPHVDLAAAARNATDPEIAKLIDEVGPSSFMIVPLVARGRGFGAITFSMAGSGRTLTTEDLEIAMELARRTASSIDNAVIYRRSLELRLEAEAASNAKSEFLAKMSHEIRTPINAMMGYAELMHMGISGPINEQQSKQLERIRASGDHLTSLIAEILDLAKIESGRMAVELTEAPVSEAIESALAFVRPAASAKGVELPSVVDGDPRARYFGDPQRVQQILANLLSNAVKFTGSGGHVHIRVDTGERDLPGRGIEADWVTVSISDNGVGIAEEDSERIFQPFIQVESGYTRSQGGTGLGLTISRNLAQLMGGELTVESSFGAGSTFTVWLPCPVRALATK